MSTDEELLSFVRQVTPAVSDTARWALADWLDEHPEHQQIPMSHSLAESDQPALVSWFNRTVLPRLRRKSSHLSRATPRWDVSSVINHLSGLSAFEFGGFSRIARRRVIVPGFSCGTHEQVNEAAATLHESWGTPVTYSRLSRYGNTAFWLVVWYDLKCCELPLPPDRTVPLTEQFVREHVEATVGGTIEASRAQLRYDNWMSKMQCESLPAARFAEVVGSVFPQARTTQRKTMIGVQWIDPRSRDAV